MTVKIFDRPDVQEFLKVGTIEYLYGPGLGITLDDDRVSFFARDGHHRKRHPTA